LIPVVLEDERLTDAGLHEVGKEMSRRLFPDRLFNKHPCDVSNHGEDFHSHKYREFCKAVVDAIFREQERRRTRVAQKSPSLVQ
jgi:hypothetical protein